MTPDHLALAKDVDRLFRARQDGRQMPVGTAPPGALWEPGTEEKRALAMADTLDHPVGHYADWRDNFVVTQRAWLRTRRHVAMLALTEPEYFQRCLNDIHEPDSRYRAGRVVDGRRLYHVYPNPSAAQQAADVARTGAYLAELQERLRPWRERDEVGRLNAAREREAVEGAEINRRTEAAIEVDGDVLAAMKV